MRVAFIDRTAHDTSDFGEVLLCPEDGEVVTVSEIKRRIRGFVALTNCKTPDIRLSASFVRALDFRTSDGESRTRIVLGRDIIKVFPSHGKPYKTKPAFVDRMRIHLRIKSP